MNKRHRNTSPAGVQRGNQAGLSLKPLAAQVRIACLPALVLGLHTGAAVAGPEGGQVVAGQGAISKPNASTTLIQQASRNLAIDWQSFQCRA